MRSILEIRVMWLNSEELLNEIVQRQALISTMVGTLYPSILQGEIDEIKEMLRMRRLSDHKHEFYTEDDFTTEEAARRNAIWVMVIEEGRKICKQCGYEEGVDDSVREN